MEYLRRWAKSSRCQLQSGGEEQKSQKKEKESEERSGRWCPGCRRYCVWPRHCRLTECDLLWWPVMRFSIKEWLSTFPQKLGFWCDYCARGAAQRVCLTSWINKTIYFWKAERKGFGMNIKKKVPWTNNNELRYSSFVILAGSSCILHAISAHQPVTLNDLIFLESSMFTSAAVPKNPSSLEYQKKRSAQLRFIPKLHNQGFTCRVCYQVTKLNPLSFVCRAVRPVCAGRCNTVILPGTLWETMFGFWILPKLYCHMKKHCATFHLNKFTNFLFKRHSLNCH